MAGPYPNALPAISQADIDRFLGKLDKSPGYGPKGDCWKYTGDCSPYGRFWIAGRNVGAHRIALAIKLGYDPFPLLACHSCDWEPCCLPEHLFPGTPADNMIDKKLKGRASSGELSGPRLHPEAMFRGEQCHTAKLTAAQVLEIVALHEAGEKTMNIYRSCRYPVSISQLYYIVKKQNWKHLFI